MIRVKVELENTEEYKTEFVWLPCNLRAVLDLSKEYVITDIEPPMFSAYGMNVEKLNEVLDEINCENPEMTVEYLELLADAAGVIDIADEEFIRRVKENDFLFVDLSNIDWKMTAEEIAACYIATVLKVPFGSGVNQAILSVLGEDVINDYIKWDDIWSEYEKMGFRIEENPDADEYNLYLVHWRK